MTPDLAFLLCNYGVLPAWLLLAVAPSHPVTRRIVHGPAIPILLALVYLTAFAMNSDGAEGGGFFSLEGVMLLFTSPLAVLAGWIHYLAFDLFVGAWEVRDAARRGIPHLLVVPCLFFTLMLGPIGLMAYLVLRGLRTGAWALSEDRQSASETVTL